MVAVRVREITVPVLTILPTAGIADGAPVEGAVPGNTVPVPDTSGHVTVLPFCVRIVGVAPGFLSFVPWGSQWLHV